MKNNIKQKPKRKDVLKVSNPIGKKGEDLSCLFLAKRGYEVVARNYLRKWGEIDIIAKKAGKLLFVEVKSVSCETLEDVSHETGHRPEENVHGKKQRALRRSIESYMGDLPEKGQSFDKEWSFAVMTVRICDPAKMARVEFIGDIVL